MRTPQLLKIKKDKSHKYNTKQKKQTQNSIILYDLPYTKFKTDKIFISKDVRIMVSLGKEGGSGNWDSAKGGPLRYLFLFV